MEIWEKKAHFSSSCWGQDKSKQECLGRQTQLDACRERLSLLLLRDLISDLSKEILPCTQTSLGTKINKSVPHLIVLSSCTSCRLRAITTMESYI